MAYELHLKSDLRGVITKVETENQTCQAPRLRKRRDRQKQNFLGPGNSTLTPIEDSVSSVTLVPTESYGFSPEWQTVRSLHRPEWSEVLE